MTAREAIKLGGYAGESQDQSCLEFREYEGPRQGNRRLVADRPGYTIRAECHGNIQYHYRLPRRISMREAARIQSFPDKFLFVSGLRETERLVGNAVSLPCSRGMWRSDPRVNYAPPKKNA
ncbi:MAG: DNA cytosine methyltransferase [Nitrospira sp.]|nr:DNA cytosine methyltransferase [Nitrospira sp.]